MKTIRSSFLLISILIVSFLIRFIGIFHDLPYSYYPDEIHFIKRAVSFGNGDMNPHWFNKPALYMYILFFEYSIFYIIGKIIGIFNNVKDYAIFYINNTGYFYFIGRITTAIFGIGVVICTYKISKDIYNKYIGIISALLISFTFGHYESSIQVKADMPATFFTLVSILFIYKIYRYGNISDYIFAGLFGGFGMATKYYSLALLFPFAIAHFLQKTDKEYKLAKYMIDKRILIVYSAFIIGFFLCSPYNFLDTTWASYYIIPRIKYIFGHEEKEIVVRGINGVSFGTVLGSMIEYAKIIMSTRGMGLGIGMISISGLLYVSILGVSDKKNIIVVSFPWFFIVLANYINPYYSEPRHQLVIYPILAMCGAVFLYASMQRVGILWSKKTAKILSAGALALLLTFPAWHIVTDLSIILQPDPRTLAKAWIEEHIPAGTKIVLDEYTPQLRMSRANILVLYKRAMKENPRGQFTARLSTYYRYLLAAHHGVSYDIAQIRFPWWRDMYKEKGMIEARGKRDVNFGNPVKKVGVMPLDYYIAHGYKYVITSTKMMRKLTMPSFAERFPAFAQFYRDLEARGTLIKEFVPRTPHPRRHAIRIYRIGQERGAPESVSSRQPDA